MQHPNTQTHPWQKLVRTFLLLITLWGMQLWLTPTPIALADTIAEVEPNNDVQGSQSNLPMAVNFPFFDDFETGIIEPSWGTTASGRGLVENDSDAPHNGNYSIFLGQKVTGDGSASLDLVIDLADQEDVYLDFWWRGTGRAIDPANAVYISENDGVKWIYAGNLSGNSQIYGHAIIHVSEIASANGLTLNNHFMIRIYYDSYGEAIGGLRIDELRVTNRPQVVASFPLQESFDTQAVQQGLYPQSWGTGLTEISDENPYSGTHHIFLGQKAAGDGSASLDLVIDLADQEDVYLDFWWRGTGRAIDPANAVYISENDGVKWIYAGNLSGNSQIYGHAIIHVSEIASANGLTLNNHFMIRIYYDSYGEAIGGLRIDELRVTNRPQVVASFPLQESFDTQAVQQGLYPQSWGTGLTEISDENPYSGTHHIFLGQKAAGDGSASLDLVIDLADQEDVYLDFWWRGTGRAIDPANAVYISENDGVKWIYAGNLSGNSQIYGHAIIHVSEIASANGLTLNNHFMIRIYYDSYGGAIGGLRIDDVRIGDIDPSKIGISYIYLPTVSK